MCVIVAGGGIGGLTTAIALRHHGIDALVLEQAETMAEIGAGIQIASNAAIVGPTDLAILLGSFGTSGPVGDIDGTCTVNSADLAILLGAWSE